MPTSKYGFAVAILMGCTATAFAAPAPGMLATSLPDAYAFPPPPAGFDPLQASDSQLRDYGFPARPNPFRWRRAYEGWARMVSAAKIWIAPQLVRTELRHRPMIPASPSNPAFGMSYSTNWSGTGLTTGANSFGSSSFYTLWGEFNVPVAQQAFGVCNSSTVYSSTWIGLDGYNGGSDIVQAGTESDAYCYDGATTGTYYAWYEWYPANTIRINNFPVLPGDDIGVQTGVSNTTSASVFMTDETTNAYVAIQFNAPAGTHFIGNSAEWIVERPSLNNNVATLANYVTDWMSNMIAVLNNGSNTLVFGGIGMQGIPSSLLTMLDKNGNPISVPTNQGGGGIVYHDAGSVK